MENTRSINCKAAPKVRIIHIIAPDIIKTDVSNFRELVQSLTGKPSKNPNITGSTSNKKRKSQCRVIENNHDTVDTYVLEKKPKIEERTVIKSEEVEEEGKVWFEANNLGNGFLKSLEEEDGFFFSYECDWYEGVFGVA